MGCDIHLYVEKRVNGKWKAADKWSRDKDDEENPKRLTVDYDARFYTGRNYNLFAILADVRNGRGFAGIKIGDGFTPIAPPRGIPDGACPEYIQECNAWGSDGHSHSHFTVSELMAYDWTQVSTLQGVVGALTFEKWERYGRSQGESPEDYCGDIYGRDIIKVEESVMRKMVKSVVEEAEKLPTHDERQNLLRSKLSNVYTTCRWEMPYYKCAGEFLGKTLPRLWRVGKPDDVRIVFFFDN